LTAGIRADACGPRIADDDFVHAPWKSGRLRFRLLTRRALWWQRIAEGALESGADGNYAEIGRGEVGERAAEFADWRPCCAHDVDGFGHVFWFCRWL
jgi:hypothetical protein